MLPPIVFFECTRFMRLNPIRVIRSGYFLAIGGGGNLFPYFDSLVIKPNLTLNLWKCASIFN